MPVAPAQYKPVVLNRFAVQGAKSRSAILWKSCTK